MGTWGPGLYSNDIAADLKGTEDGALRVPVGADEVVDLLRQCEPRLDEPESEDYASCWFVVADRFHRCGLRHEPTLRLVRSLLASGVDLRVNEELGMSSG